MKKVSISTTSIAMLALKKVRRFIEDYEPSLGVISTSSAVNTYVLRFATPTQFKEPNYIDRIDTSLYLQEEVIDKVKKITRTNSTNKAITMYLEALYDIL